MNELTYYCIQTPAGYVSRYNEDHMIIEVSTELKYARKFYSLAGAHAFAVEHADTGLGLVTGQYTVEQGSVEV